MKLANLKGYICGEEVLDTSINRKGELYNLHGLSAETYKLKADIRDINDIKVLMDALKVLSYSLMKTK